MDIRDCVGAALKNGGWIAVFNSFDESLPRIAKERQAAFVDLFFMECLTQIDDATSTSIVWSVASRWYSSRKLPAAGYQLSDEEESTLLPLISLLRTKLDRNLELQFPPPAPPEAIARSMVGFWQELFLSSFSPLHQQGQQQTTSLLNALPATESSGPLNYGWLLRMSMYYPFDADRFCLDSQRLTQEKIPAYVKVILVMWMVNVPRYNANQYHRQKVCQYLPEIFRATKRSPTWLDPFFHRLAEWIMVVLFRLAYVHEDNSALTRQFGDFVAAQMRRILSPPPLLLSGPDEARRRTRRIRVGYISTRFVANAVTFYMANRILHHDRNTFEIYLFVIGDRQDEMTQLLAQKSDQVICLENSLDYRQNSLSIAERQLDILLYADIGMDISTYLLAGMRLAPIQGALLGHASPTGLPTMDYFFSSQVEPPSAVAHYREQLIRLPNVGASQTVPPGLQLIGKHPISRKQMGIPEDAVVFISCANGMKHVPERDYIWTEILHRSPQSWILLKPFSTWDYDRQLVERIRHAGKMAGAEDRIRFLAGQAEHNDVFGLLSLADVQLDTYPFNGWTTTVEALCLALPTVTQEGNAYRSRLGAGFLRAMGITEGIAADEEEYIQWAVTFASDPALRRWIKNRIKATRQHLLFDNIALQMEYEKALIEMIRKQRGATPCG